MSKEEARWGGEEEREQTKTKHNNISVWWCHGETYYFHDALQNE